MRMLPASSLDSSVNKLLKCWQWDDASTPPPTKWRWDISTARWIFPILDNETEDAPPPNCSFPRAIGAHLIHYFFVPPQICLQMAPRSVQPFLYGLQLCPTETHRPRYICNSRPHLCTVCMWCGLTRKYSAVRPSVTLVVSRLRPSLCYTPPLPSPLSL